MTVNVYEHHAILQSRKNRGDRAAFSSELGFHIIPHSCHLALEFIIHYVLNQLVPAFKTQKTI